MRRLLQRLGFALAVAAVAVLCMSSAYIAGLIGLLTAAVVAVDMLVFTRPAKPSADAPDKLSVDLNRRP